MNHGTNINYYQIPKVSKSLLTKGAPVLEGGKWLFSEPESLGCAWNKLLVGEDPFSDTSSLSVGRYFDNLVLPDESNTERFIVKEFNQKKAVPDGFTSITYTDNQMVQEMVRSIQTKSNYYRDIIDLGMPKQQVYEGVHEPTGLEIKCRLDALYVFPDSEYVSIVDIKTTAEPSLNKFLSTAVYSYHYDLQAAMYCYILRQNGIKLNPEIPFFFIVCSKKKTQNVWQVGYTNEHIDQAMVKFDDLMEAFKELKENDFVTYTPDTILTAPYFRY